MYTKSQNPIFIGTSIYDFKNIFSLSPRYKERDAQTVGKEAFIPCVFTILTLVSIKISSDSKIEHLKSL